MIDPLLLSDLFAETYALVRRHMAGLRHVDSLRNPPFTANGVNWVVGDTVATRANILVGILDAPNRWDTSMLMRYIAESAPVTGDLGAWRFEQLLHELARTQE